MGRPRGKKTGGNKTRKRRRRTSESSLDDVTAERLREENEIPNMEENSDNCENTNSVLVCENMEESDVETKSFKEQHAMK